MINKEKVKNIKKVINADKVKNIRKVSNIEKVIGPTQERLVL